jgi:hypothetical protein
MKLAGQLVCVKLSSRGGKRTGLDWIFNGCGSSLTQPEQEKNRGEPEEKPSHYEYLEPMHFFDPLRDAGEASRGEGLIICKIQRLGNGANVFTETATPGTIRG